MSKSKRRKQFTAQQNAANTILTNRDLETNPLTAAEILALPRNQRPPRSEWPDAGGGNNPKPYAKRRRPMKREWFPSSGGGSGEDVWNVIIFLALWAVCSLVEYGVYSSLGMADPYLIFLAIFTGLISACVVLGVFHGGSGGGDLTRWW